MTRCSSVPRARYRALKIGLLAACLTILGVWAFSQVFVVTKLVSERLLLHIRDGGLWFTGEKWEIMLTNGRHGAHVCQHVSRIGFPVSGRQGDWIVIPFWTLLAVPVSAIILLKLVSMHQLQLITADGCCAYGYDLRGSAQRCSECDRRTKS